MRRDMHPAEALIFDLDGVLVDTFDLHFQSWKHLADLHGIPFTPARMHDFRGRQRRDCLISLFDGRPLSDQSIEEYLSIKNQVYLQRLNQTSPEQLLAPGVRALCQQAKTLGLKLGVASSSANALHVLQQVDLLPLLDVVADGDTVARSKPAADIFLWVAGALGVRPHACVVLEDSEAGIRAALDGGMQVVGVGHEPHLSMAHLVAPDLHTLPIADLLEKLNLVPTWPDRQPVEPDLSTPIPE